MRLLLYCISLYFIVFWLWVTVRVLFFIYDASLTIVTSFQMAIYRIIYYKPPRTMMRTKRGHAYADTLGGALGLPP